MVVYTKENLKANMQMRVGPFHDGVGERSIRVNSAVLKGRWKVVGNQDEAEVVRS